MPSSLLSAGTQDNEASVGTIAWFLAGGDVFSSNNDYAAATLDPTEQSQYLIAQTFGFSIPTGATILGIVVKFERSASVDGVDYPEIKDVSIRLVKGGVISGDNKADLVTAWGTADSITPYGATSGVDGLWGLTWTASDINSSTFGVVMSVAAGAGLYTVVANVDHITIEVYYSVDAIDPSPSHLVVGFVSAVRRVSLRSQRGRSAIVGPLTDEPPTATDMAFVEIVSAQRRFAGSRSRFVNATPGTSSIFSEPAFTESVWLEQIVAPIRPRGMHALRPLAYLVQVDLPAGNGACECNPGGAVLLGYALGAVLVSVTDYSLGVGQYGATLVSQGFGRAVLVSVCEC
jgi:hypothetical protein